MTESKAYTEAIRELLRIPFDAQPATWPANQKDWSAAQTWAARDLALAMAGDADACKRVLERAEGRPPSAPEDRAQRDKADDTQRISALAVLARLQSVLQGRPVDVELLPESTDEKEDDDGGHS